MRARWKVGIHCFIWLKNRGSLCSHAKKHHMHELTCVTGRKKSLENLAVVHTRPQNYAFVSDNVAFSLLSIAGLPNSSVMATLEFLLVTLRQYFTTVSLRRWHTLLLFTSAIVASAVFVAVKKSFFFCLRKNYSFSFIWISLTRLRRWVLTALILLVYEIKLQKLPQTSAHMTKVLR